MEFLQDHWGDLFSVAGFVIALWAALSARAAKSAANEARDRIVRTLTVVDVQKAVSLIENLKYRQADSRWEAALDRYPDLRELLFNLEAQLPESDTREMPSSKEPVRHSLWRSIRTYSRNIRKPENHTWAVLTSNPDVLEQFREGLIAAAAQVAQTEDQVTQALALGKKPADTAAFTRMLNDVQSLLQRLASRLNMDSG